VTLVVGNCPNLLPVDARAAFSGTLYRELWCSAATRIQAPCTPLTKIKSQAFSAD
jgi:hypothetical protein